MRSRSLIGLFVAFSLWAAPLHAAGRLILRVNGGRTVAQTVCFLAGCSVAQGLDGTLGQLFLVTTPLNVNINGVLNLLSSLLGVVGVEVDQVAQLSGTASIPPALLDTTPISYYGSTVPHGYVFQPATENIHLSQMRAAFPNATGAGIVAIIDTGVDTQHPALQSVLLPGYDFTRNQSGADEKRDVSLTSTPVTTGVSPNWVSGSGTGDVSQSTAAVVDQSTAAVVDGNPQLSDFGHGTMVTGLVHLVAPTARILPLKAFRSDGTGYLSDILRAVYTALGAHANVLNMSFSLSSYSPEVAFALNLGTLTGTISVAAAGNNGQNTLVYPAALSNVMGVASTDNNSQLSLFSNYGSQAVWLAAPGEGVVTTYPFSTYAAAWGTSFSTPLVSGLASSLLSINIFCDQYSGAASAAHATPMTSAAGHGQLDLYQAMSSWSLAVGGN